MTRLRQDLKVVSRKILKLTLLPFALPMVLAIRLIKPLTVVRIGFLNSERIGHLAGDTELYLCERDAGINIPSKSYIDVWYHSGAICNKTLASMWKRSLNIGPSLLLSLVDRLNRFLRGHEVHGIRHQSRDTINLLDRFPPHISFITNEEERGQTGLRALGIPDKAPFVCLSVRDSAYLDRTYPKGDWGGHDYRDSNIQNYVFAAQGLALRGYYLVRMGVVVKERFPVSHPMIIDYAAKDMRSDFMDIYLGAKCDFFVSTGTGIDALAMVFRRPYVFVNLVPVVYCHTATTKHIFIVKKHWLRSEKRFMTFREIFESGAGLFLDSQQFENMGIELIENSPEEIAAVVLEMESRLRGTWCTTDQDEELQKRFWDIFPKNGVSPYNSQPLHGEIRSRIGTEFLRQNKALLE